MQRPLAQFIFRLDIGIMIEKEACNSKMSFFEARCKGVLPDVFPDKILARRTKAVPAACTKEFSAAT